MLYWLFLLLIYFDWKLYFPELLLMHDPVTVVPKWKLHLIWGAEVMQKQFTLGRLPWVYGKLDWGQSSSLPSPFSVTLPSVQQWPRLITRNPSLNHRGSSFPKTTNLFEVPLQQLDILGFLVCFIGNSSYTLKSPFRFLLYQVFQQFQQSRSKSFMKSILE